MLSSFGEGVLTPYAPPECYPRATAICYNKRFLTQGANAHLIQWNGQFFSQFKNAAEMRVIKLSGLRLNLALVLEALDACFLFICTTFSARL